MLRLTRAALVFFLLGACGALFGAPATNTETGRQNKDQKSTDLGAVQRDMSRYDGARGNGEAVGPGGLGTFVETVLVLALFVAGIWGVFRFVQKKRGTTLAGGTVIRVLASLSVGGTRTLQLVEVGPQVFLVGVTDGAISPIAEIRDKETIDWIRLESQRVPSGGREGFLEKVFSMLGKEGSATGAAGGAAAGRDGAAGASGAAGESGPARVDFLRRQRERLARMDKPDKRN